MIGRRLNVLRDRYGDQDIEDIAATDATLRDLDLQRIIWNETVIVCEQRGRVPVINANGELAWLPARN